MKWIILLILSILMYKQSKHRLRMRTRMRMRSGFLEGYQKLENMNDSNCKWPYFIEEHQQNMSEYLYKDRDNVVFNGTSCTKATCKS